MMMNTAKDILRELPKDLKNIVNVYLQDRDLYNNMLKELKELKDDCIYEDFPFCPLAAGRYLESDTWGYEIHSDYYESNVHRRHDLMLIELNDTFNIVLI